MLNQSKLLLEEPSYGYIKEDKLVVPTVNEVLLEVVSRISVFDKQKWLTTLIFLISLFFISHLVLFIVFYFSWKLLAFMFFYALVVMSCYSNLWTHRFCVHKSYEIKNKYFKLIISNLVIKAVTEETHVISHHVHHWSPDTPGDPYNPKGGFWYCFFSDFTHQNIRRDLSKKQYERVYKMLSHTGTSLNSYDQYLYWGTASKPVDTIAHYLLNWMFWYSLFYLVGGMPLVCVSFGAAALWSFSYRTLNYRIHGCGENQHIKGRDFYLKDLSVNRMIPGFLAGEWHNNHHMFPTSARCGFLWYQIDFPWYFIRLMNFLGIVKSYRNNYSDFHFKNMNTFTDKDKKWLLKA